MAWRVVLARNIEVDAPIAERGADDCLDGPSMKVAAWLDGQRRASVGHIFLVSKVHVRVDRDKTVTQELLRQPRMVQSLRRRAIIRSEGIQEEDVPVRFSSGESCLQGTLKSTLALLNVSMTAWTVQV